MQNSRSSFFRKLFFFTMPIVTIIGLFVGLSFYVGESTPPRWIIQRQMTAGHEVLYDALWSRRELIEYKLQATIKRNPQVLVLSSSRGFSFQSDLFTEPSAFYNASINALGYYEILEFLERLVSADALPPVIIINVDYHFFAPQYVDYNRRVNDFRYDYSNVGYIHDHTRNAAKQWLVSPLTIVSNVINVADNTYHQAGLKSLNENGGFRNDGSYYHPLFEDKRLQQMERGLDSFSSGNGFYVQSDEVSPVTTGIYGDMLALADQHGTTLIGYIPPFQSIVYNQLTPENGYGYISGVQVGMSQLFAEYEMPLFLFETPAAAGGTDLEMYDLHHPGEVLAWRMFMAMVEAEPQLFEGITDYPYLRTLRQNSNNDIYLFGNQP